MRSLFGLPALIGLHLLATGVASAAFAWTFGHGWRAVAAHVLLVASWDAALAAAAIAVRPPRVVYRTALVVTGTLQMYLYVLNVVSNLSWGRNMTGRLVASFAPTIWSGREPFPVGATGITLITCAVVAGAVAVVWLLRHALDRALAAWRSDRRWPALAAAAGLAAGFSATLAAGIAARDNLFWKQEMLASFFRPEGFAFEPTARRHAVAERDAVLRASYPRQVAGARRKHVVLVIVDSLRADRMQVYGYGRPTTPFLSALVARGRMRKVDAAFSTCSESFCGITSTLSGRGFRDISARTFQLQDVLRDQGYDTWFLLSGNHRAWNGLPQFYRASDARLFDGSETRRYTMDDDRLVLEGLERVPDARPGQPAFFYVHLMSPHYLGVQFEESHVFTPRDDRVSPGLEPYKILDQLNKPDRYDDKVLQADGIIRRLFDGLEAKGYLGDSIVVVTGDHGEGLGERRLRQGFGVQGHWAHGWHLYNEDIRIPLLIFDEPSASYPDLTFAAQVDIAPTIVDRLGLPVPESWEGESLLAPSRTRVTYHQTYFFPNRFAALYRDDDALFKFIATPHYGNEELYDLGSDREERVNLVHDRPALAAMLREGVQEYRADGPNQPTLMAR